MRSIDAGRLARHDLVDAPRGALAQMTSPVILPPFDGQALLASTHARKVRAAAVPVQSGCEGCIASANDGAPLTPATRPGAAAGSMPEPASPTRSAFQRDRDRIVHSSAFRRLKHKTQVFVFHEGDHYRTRLTHSIEVSQIARALARALGARRGPGRGARALARPRPHAVRPHRRGRARTPAWRAFGGFDHNAQALRLVTRLERRYAEFDGLNLTWETLEGPRQAQRAAGRRGRASDGPLRRQRRAARDPRIRRAQPLGLSTFASAEAQVAALADDIAYNAHDIDDGLRAGLFADRGASRGAVRRRPPGRGRRPLSRARAAAPHPRGRPAGHHPLRRGRDRRERAPSRGACAARGRRDPRAPTARSSPSRRRWRRRTRPSRPSSTRACTAIRASSRSASRPRQWCATSSAASPRSPPPCPRSGGRLGAGRRGPRGPPRRRLHRRHDRQLRAQEHRRLFEATPELR